MLRLRTGQAVKFKIKYEADIQLPNISPMDLGPLLEAIRTKLDKCNTLAEIYELVKQSVKLVLNQHWAGLMLGLANLGIRRGSFVGALYPVGSNIIVMNKAPFEVALRSTEKNVFNAYCFHLLLHEYPHALGYVSEEQIRDLVYEVCNVALGKDNPATIMAERGIAFYFPKVTYLSQKTSMPKDLQIEIIKDFDKSSTSYIN